MFKLRQEFVDIIEAGLFKLTMGITQYTTDGVYIYGLKMDLEHEFYIVEGKITVTRNRYPLYYESIRKFKADYLGVEA